VWEQFAKAACCSAQRSSAREREADDVPVCEATGESGQHEECDAMCAGPDAQAERGCAEHRLHGERARGRCVSIYVT
jgi:hypothetical protein